METLQILYTFLYLTLDHFLPSVQQQFFLVRTDTSFEESLPELYVILLEEHVQIALEMLEMLICSSLSLKNRPQWFNDDQIW
jgi:hypothetical protein